jgi:hypothetical protein
MNETMFNQCSDKVASAVEATILVRFAGRARKLNLRIAEALTRARSSCSNRTAALRQSTWRRS